MIVTDKDEHDGPVLPRLIEGCDLSGKTLIGDGAYDTKRCYTAVHETGGKLLAPTKLSARPGASWSSAACAAIGSPLLRLPKASPGKGPAG